MTTQSPAAMIRNSYGAVERVDIRKAGKVWRFYAPGWRPMSFTSEAAARAKVASHYAFVTWA